MQTLMLLPYMLYVISNKPDFGTCVGDYTALLVFAMKNVLIFPIDYLLFMAPVILLLTFLTGTQN